MPWPTTPHRSVPFACMRGAAPGEGLLPALPPPSHPAPAPRGAPRPAGVSLLKFDNCFSEGEGEVMERFVAMRDALLATNASIVYMLCEWVRPVGLISTKQDGMHVTCTVLLA